MCDVCLGFPVTKEVKEALKANSDQSGGNCMRIGSYPLYDLSA